MFGDKPEKLPSLDEVHRQFDHEIRQKLKQAYDSDKKDGTDVHDFAKGLCDGEIPNFCHNAKETAILIGITAKMRGDHVTRAIRKEVPDGQEETAQLFVGRLAMENGDH
jgi:hypothetical protein